MRTSEIEGENLNPQQVRSSVARRPGMDIAGAVPADRNVEGVVKMMMDATQQIVSGPMGREAVHYEAPPANKVDAEMTKFIAWANLEQGMDPVLKSAIAHLWFVTIHPFDDGNGRIARAIADWVLARAENSGERFYSMSAQIRHERNDYYSILEYTQTGSLDITTWL